MAGKIRRLWRRLKKQLSRCWRSSGEKESQRSDDSMVQPPPRRPMSPLQLRYRLGVSLFKEICREEKENFVISPLSLGMALAMLTAGLRGRTQTELLKLFGATHENDIHLVYSALMSEKDLPLKIANMYLARENMRIHPEFESRLKETYESEIESVNFARDGPEIEAKANAWVADKTNGMIQTILPEGSLSYRSLLLLLNAVYFKGSWLGEFDLVPNLMDFKLRCGKTVKRSFMRKKSHPVELGFTETLSLVRIPYKESGFSMLVAIPSNKQEDIHDVINGMTTKGLIGAMQSTKPADGEFELLMPKFKIEYDFDSATDVLNKLGVKEIFTPDVGDFGNLFVDEGRGPFVDAIHHKAVIEVDEKGTTAAGVTAVGFEIRCLPIPKPTVVVLDRPFLFFIMSAIDVVCFSGICCQP